MAAHINGLFTESPAAFRNICYGNVIERPKEVFIECRWSLLYSYLNAIKEVIVLPQQVLFLHEVKQVRVISLTNEHV